MFLTSLCFSKQFVYYLHSIYTELGAVSKQTLFIVLAEVCVLTTCKYDTVLCNGPSIWGLGKHQGS